MSENLPINIEYDVTKLSKREAQILNFAIVSLFDVFMNLALAAAPADVARSPMELQRRRLDTAKLLTENLQRCFRDLPIRVGLPQDG